MLPTSTGGTTTSRGLKEKPVEVIDEKDAGGKMLTRTSTPTYYIGKKRDENGRW
jgi:hypothetical protein